MIKYVVYDLAWHRLTGFVLCMLWPGTGDVEGLQQPCRLSQRGAGGRGGHLACDDDRGSSAGVHEEHPEGGVHHIPNPNPNPNLNPNPKAEYVTYLECRAKGRHARLLHVLEQRMSRGRMGGGIMSEPVAPLPVPEEVPSPVLRPRVKQATLSSLMEKKARHDSDAVLAAHHSVSVAPGARSLIGHTAI